MTLIELMIVVVLIAGMMTIAAFNLGVLGQADVHSEALRFSSAVRYSFTLAASSNQTLQMKLDFDKRRFEVERLELSGGLSQDELRGTTLANQNTQRRDSALRAERLDEEDSRFGKVGRVRLDENFLSEDDVQLADGVYFIGLMTSHHDEIQRDAIGTINFFSNGFVERSVVYLGDEAAAQGLEGGIVYTVIIHPLNGQSSVVPGQFEIGSSFFEEEQDD